MDLSGKTVDLENLVTKVMKILSGENNSLIPLNLKNQLQVGKLLQGEIINILPKRKATISIEGQKVVAELPDVRIKNEDRSAPVKPDYSFKPGQKIYARVEETTPSPVLKLVPPPGQKIQEGHDTTHISSRFKPVVEALTLEKFGELKLPTDRTVRVSVSRVIDAKTLLVQFGDQKFSVKTENADLYSLGSSVRVQFQKTDKGFIPKLLDTAANIGVKTIDLELLKPYLPSRTPFGKMVGELTRDILNSPLLKEFDFKPQALERLRETLQALTPKADLVPGELKIKEQVEKSGIRYEAKVKQFLEKPENSEIRIEIAKDLKGQLLNLLQAAKKKLENLPEQNNQFRQISDFQQKIKISVDNIELNQLSSRVSMQENQPLVIQIPNPLSPGDKTINLFIREDLQEDGKGKKDGKRDYNLAFFLDLSSLGKIKINATVDAESLKVQMDVEDEDIAEFIRKKSIDFEEKMKKSSLNTTVECCSREEINPQKDDLIELLVSQSASLLSVRT